MSCLNPDISFKTEILEIQTQNLTFVLNLKFDLTADSTAQPAPLHSAGERFKVSSQLFLILLSYYTGTRSSQQLIGTE